MFSSEIDDLKLQIIDVKKQNVKLQQENSALKIKMRKLETTITHRNKIIDLLNKDDQPLLKRYISENGSSVFITLKEENENLKLKISDQQQTIRRLRQGLISSKLYIPSYSKFFSGTVKSARSYTSSKCFVGLHPKSSSAMDKRQKENVVQRAISADRCKSKANLEIPLLKNVNGDLPETLDDDNKDENPEYSEIETEPDGEDEEDDLTSASEDSIEEKSTEDQKGAQEKSPDEKSAPKRTSSVMVQVGTAKDDKPHEEIQLLQNSFKDIIDEVKGLKESIFSIQKEQVKTCSVLQQKDSNLEKLATEIKNLSKTQYNATRRMSENSSELQNYKALQMETKYKLNNRNPIGGVYGLTPKMKSEYNVRRQQYKVISSPKYDRNVKPINKNERRIVRNESDVDVCIKSIISDL